MKKFLTIAMIGSLLVFGVAMLTSTAPKAEEVEQLQVADGKTSMETPPCRYPEQPDCPLTEEQKALLDTPHPISAEFLQQIKAEEGGESLE